MAEQGDGVVARPASTVMVLRDGRHPTYPLEVLMLRRSLAADFAGGAHVFPGGAVDPADGGPLARRHCPGLSDGQASAILGVPEGGLAYFVAAVRECFEESGLLLARWPDGAPVDFTRPGVRARFAGHRAALNARERSFLDVCAAEHLSLSVDSLHYFAHWITPEGSSRRYDTRFFVAAAPEGQSPAHDAGETISDLWVRPADALERHQAGRMEIVLPTLKNLEAIGRFATTAEVLAAASSGHEVPAILPRLVAEDGGVRILLPGDAGYDEPPSGDAGDTTWAAGRG